MGVKPIPEGYHSVTPYLVVKGVASQLAFLKQAFDAIETERTTTSDGIIRHAEVSIGDSKIMIGEAWGEYKPIPACLLLYVPDVETVYRRALEAGGISLREPENTFYGDRSGGVKDSCGNQWWISTHVEDVPPEEVARRAEAMGKH
jgi:PhnB protein